MDHAPLLLAGDDIRFYPAEIPALLHLAPQGFDRAAVRRLQRQVAQLLRVAVEIVEFRSVGRP